MNAVEQNRFMMLVDPYIEGNRDNIRKWPRHLLYRHREKWGVMYQPSTDKHPVDWNNEEGADTKVLVGKSHKAGAYSATRLRVLERITVSCSNESLPYTPGLTQGHFERVIIKRNVSWEIPSD